LLFFDLPGYLTSLSDSARLCVCLPRSCFVFSFDYACRGPPPLPFESDSCRSPLQHGPGRSLGEMTDQVVIPFFFECVQFRVLFFFPFQQSFLKIVGYPSSGVWPSFAAGDDFFLPGPAAFPLLSIRVGFSRSQSFLSLPWSNSRLWPPSAPLAGFYFSAVVFAGRLCRN